MNKFQEIMEEKMEENEKKMKSSTPDSYSKKLEKINNMSKEERIKRVYKDMLDNFDIPKRFQGKTFKNYKPYSDNEKAYKKVIEYVKNFEERFKNGDWLILSGGYGLGKTHLALAAARQILKYFSKKYIERNPQDIYYSGASKKIIFKTSSELIQGIRDSYDSDMINEVDVMRRYRGIPLLIIDDLGTEKASEWQHEKMYNILDYRYRELLPTIVTTNLNSGELKNQVSERVVERMIEAAGNGKYLWKFQGKSYRRSDNQ